MPIAALIEERIFCVHGGLSPEAPDIDSIRNIDRRMEIPHDGVLCDLVWSDPDDVENWSL